MKTENGVLGDPTEAPLSFEAAYGRLRESVEALESGPLPLEAAIARYEEAVRLARLCQQILDQAELRIEQVLRDSESDLDEE